MMQRRVSVLTLFRYTTVISVVILSVYYIVVIHSQHKADLMDVGVQTMKSLQTTAQVTPRHPTTKSRNVDDTKHWRKTDLQQETDLRKERKLWGETKLHNEAELQNKRQTLGETNLYSQTQFQDKAKLQSINQKQTVQFMIDPHKRYLKRSFAGRLGNVLFEFASAFCIAQLNNLTLIVKDAKWLGDIRYQGITVRPDLWRQLPLSPIVGHSPGTCCGFNPKMMKLEPTETHHSLGGYLQSWKYFEPCKAEVKSVLSFNADVVNKSLRILADLTTRLPHRTLVGVHVRMEDYLTKRAIQNGKKVAPPQYYHRAMAYFRSKFRDVTFVVITLKPTWFRKNITNATDVTILPRSDSPAVDMEVLSRMDHVIMTVGTFGWWAAYKNNGTVVAYKDFFVPNSRYGRQMWNNARDYFYPGWVLI